jgi:hypothetical protein
MKSSLNPVVRSLYDIFKGIDFTECKDCNKCCFSPWFLKEEYEYFLDKFQQTIKEVDSIDLIPEFCVYKKENKCTFYKDRPLDCRMFPLDIIEEDNVYYWIIFTTCPKHQQIRKKLIPLIPKLEEKITGDILRQYKDQIAVTKKIYDPYRLKQYEKIREFQEHKKKNNL